MFKFIHIRDNGDCTCDYNIELDKDYIVEEFIKEVLSSNPDEWGSIGIDDGVGYSHGTPYCDYKNGKLLTKLPDEVLSKKVSKVTSSGGWSLMDYKILLKGD